MDLDCSEKVGKKCPVDGSGVGLPINHAQCLHAIMGTHVGFPLIESPFQKILVLWGSYKTVHRLFSSPTRNVGWCREFSLPSNHWLVIWKKALQLKNQVVYPIMSIGIFWRWSHCNNDYKCIKPLENGKTGCYLPYSDQYSIPQTSHKYLKLAVTKTIIDVISVGA